MSAMNLKRIIPVLVSLGIASLASSVLWISIPFRLDELGYSLSTLGILQSANIIGVLLTEIPANMLIDIKGRKWTILFGLVILSGSLALISVTTSFIGLITEIGVSSAGYNFVGQAVAILLYETTEEGSRSRASSLSMVTTSLGSFIGLATTALLRITSLQGIYLGLSVVVVILGVSAGSLVHKGKTVSLTQAEPSGSKKAVKEISSEISILKNVMKENSFIRIYVVIQAFISLATGSSLFFLTALSLNLGLSVDSVFLLFSFASLISLPSFFVGGYLADKRLPKSVFFILRPIFLMAIFLVLIFAGNVIILISGIILVEVSGLVMPGNSVYVFDQFTDAERVMAQGTTRFVTHLIGAFAPILGLGLWTISPSILFTVDLVITIPVLVISVSALRRPRRSAIMVS